MSAAQLIASILNCRGASGKLNVLSLCIQKYCREAALYGAELSQKSQETMIMFGFL